MGGNPEYMVTKERLKGYKEAYENLITMIEGKENIDPTFIECELIKRESVARI